jgi:hypothetical protein
MCSWRNKFLKREIENTASRGGHLTVTSQPCRTIRENSWSTNQSNAINYLIFGKVTRTALQREQKDRIWVRRKIIPDPKDLLAACFSVLL